MSTAKVASSEKNRKEIYLNKKSSSFNSINLNDPIKSKKEDNGQNGNEK